MNQVTLKIGAGDLEYLDLAAADGARAQIYLQGAHVTSWVPAGGVEQLYLSPRSIFKTGAALRGGVPVIFPQFAGQGPLPKHGFARNRLWKLVNIHQPAQGEASAAFELVADEQTRQIWPFDFLARYKVRLTGQNLDLTLFITNMDCKPFTFTSALHTYFRVNDLTAVRVVGLEQTAYCDTVGGRFEKEAEHRSLAIQSEVDRIYWNTPADVRLVEPGRSLRIGQNGFKDSVVWNPGPVLGATLADLEPAGYQSMLCIESAAIGQPITLKPAETWSASQNLSVEA
jgi:glucose-6-phosphate 1-epimerase